MSSIHTPDFGHQPPQQLNSTFINNQILEAIEIASEYGIKIEFCTDFSDFAAACAELQPERKSSPINLFKPEEINNNGFWIKGINTLGQIVHTQAIRYFDTQDLSLSRYFAENRELFCPIDQGLDPKRAVFNKLPITSNISGSIAYHGEIFVSNEYRGTGLALPLTRIAVAKAFLNDLDFMIGFVVPLVGYKGIPARYGYPHAQPNGILWFEPNSNECAWNDWLVWASSIDLENTLSLSMRQEHSYLIRPARNTH